jgi:hypothetical protein
MIRHQQGVEEPPDLDEEDEKLLDQAWKTVTEWSPAYQPGSKTRVPTDILGWGRK